MISGKNGKGKCLDPSTEIDIEFENSQVEKDFIKFIKSSKLKFAIKDISDFYNKYPQHKSKVMVKSRFGYKRIIDAGITAYNSDVIRLVTNFGKKLDCSPDHRLLSNDLKWKHVKDIKIGDVLFSEDDTETVSRTIPLSIKKDLYDIQVEDVKEFYANGIVSHNSSIVEVIYFALYGKSYRKINQMELINRSNNKELMVKIHFTNKGSHYNIERGLKPNVLRLHKNGSLMKEGVSKREYQKEIDSAIGIDFKLFNQLCLIDSTFYQPFMNLGSIDKRRVIDNIFGLDHITQMMFKCKDYKSKINEKLNIGRNDIELVKEKIRINKDFNNDNLVKQIDLLKNENDESEKGIVDAEKQELDLKKIISGKNEWRIKLTEKLEVANRERTTCKDDLNHCHYKLKDLKKKRTLVDSGTCDTCERDFSEDDRHKRIVNIDVEKFKIEHMLKLHSDKIESTAIAHEVVVIKLERLDDEISEHTKKKSELGWSMNNCHSNIEKNNVKIKQLEEKLNDNTDTILLEKELRENQQVFAKDHIMYQRVTKCETVLSDSGIRSYIIKKYLPMFNDSLKKYLDIMEADFAFEFDAEFNQHINPRYRSCFNYESLSSGQKTRVNLAILFSLIDFAEKKSGSRLNILILDEVIESMNLDERGKENILDIIKNMISKKMIVISHNYNIQDMFDKHAHVTINAGFSVMEVK